ncbi:hypothetical protein JXA70_10765 [candidate division KSB1 bacterium]|nr:hypothetical protein [candidate division KSB1 bacterium]
MTIKTILNWDASFQRTISVSGDSSGVDETAYPFPQDGSWDMMRHKEDGSYTYVIQKDFSNVAELNKEVAYREDTVQVNAFVNLDKKFRWFYTYYRYEETFFKTFPFSGADIQDFVTESELATYRAGKDSTDIEERIEEYAQHAMFEDYYRAMQQAVQNGTFVISDSALAQRKQELFEKAMDWEFYNFEDEDFARHFLKTCDTVYAPPVSFMQLKPELAEVNQKYVDYLAFISAIIGEDYRVEVYVPGRVIDTNANHSVNDDNVVWEFSADQFLYFDYALWVESRRFNILPTVITGAFVMTVIMLLWLSARRSYRQKLAAKGIAWEDRKRFVLKWWMSLLLIIAGLILAGWFTWMLILFYSEPPLFFLDIFNPTPAEKTLVISLLVLGFIMIIYGSYQLTLHFHLRKISRDCRKR